MKKQKKEDLIGILIAVLIILIGYFLREYFE